MVRLITESLGRERDPVSVDITTESEENEDKAEKVHMHAKDEAVKAIQAFVVGSENTEEQDGLPISVLWEQVASKEPKEDDDAKVAVQLEVEGYDDDAAEFVRRHTRLEIERAKKAYENRELPSEVSLDGRVCE